MGEEIHLLLKKMSSITFQRKLLAMLPWAMHNRLKSMKLLLLPGMGVVLIFLYAHNVICCSTIKSVLLRCTCDY